MHEDSASSSRTNKAYDNFSVHSYWQLAQKFAIDVNGESPNLYPSGLTAIYPTDTATPHWVI